MERIKVYVGNNDYLKVDYYEYFDVLDETDSSFMLDPRNKIFQGVYIEDFKQVKPDVVFYKAFPGYAEQYLFFVLYGNDDEGDVVKYNVAVPRIYDWSSKKYNSNYELRLYAPFTNDDFNFTAFMDKYLDYTRDEATESFLDEVLMNTPYMSDTMYHDIRLDVESFFDRLQ